MGLDSNRFSVGSLSISLVSDRFPWLAFSNNFWFGLTPLLVYRSNVEFKDGFAISISSMSSQSPYLNPRNLSIYLALRSKSIILRFDIILWVWLTI